MLKSTIFDIKGEGGDRRGELVAYLADIPGIKLKGIKFDQNKNNDFSIWGTIYREVPEGVLFVTTIISEIEAAITKAGATLSAVETDQSDAEIDPSLVNLNAK